MILVKCELGCNFGCLYCYEGPIKPGEKKPEIDYEAVEAEIERAYGIRPSTICLHGGEPTTLPKDKIERILKKGFEIAGKTSIQTNGYLIDDDHIELFKKYKTGVGLSVDGPWPLNEFRGKGDKKKRKRQTKKILKNLDKMKEAGIGVSVIAVIHKANGTGDRIEVMKRWVKELHDKGISGVRRAFPGVLMLCPRIFLINKNRTRQ